jgi:hypothetical protein
LVSVSESVVWRVAMTSPRIIYTPHSDATPEAELSALAVIYALVHSNSQAKRGGTHDLTNESTKKRTTGPGKKG